MSGSGYSGTDKIGRVADMRARTFFGVGFVVAALAAGIGLFVTRPMPLDVSALDGIIADAERGQAVFAAAGCASCHTAKGSEPSAQPILAGGREFPSPFGTFVAPNISPDPTHGIGTWSDIELASAITRGVSPVGAHYFPAFPYASYNKAELQDIADLISFLRTLPPDATPDQPHKVGFPFNIRASLGGWKMLFVSEEWALSGEVSPQVARGRYLVEALGHCTECHTSRNLLGGLNRDAWLAGAPHPSGKGRIPNITPGALSWSEEEIAQYLASGLTPEFDVAGGEMFEVVQNTSQLSNDDRLAIAAYLKAIPAIEN